jgi:DNA-binding response OmpR family regulator
MLPRKEKNLLLITDRGESSKELCSGLAQKGFNCSVASAGAEVLKPIAEHTPDLVLLDINERSANLEIREISQKIKEGKPLPIIALVNSETLNSFEEDLNTIDDFVVKSNDLGELVLRVKRLLQKTADFSSEELIRCGNLTIDMAKCEVTVSGRLVELAFKEYELLKFLVRNQGRVFTRETMLNKIWGYDYYGGDRTVDVHIRRLRSKIEDPSHTFIKTVRNIGYRFKPDT